MRQTTQKTRTERGTIWLLALAGILLAAVGGARAQNLTTENVRGAETEVGDLVADAVRAAANADAAFIPAAAFKQDARAPRPASAEQVAGLLEPATDTIVVLTLRGAQILEALERSVSLAPQKGALFLQVSGVRFHYDASKPGGKRVRDVTVGGAALGAAKTYKVATTRPLAHFQQGYFQIWSKDQITDSTDKTLRNALEALARERGSSLSGATDGRITADK